MSLDYTPETPSIPDFVPSSLAGREYDISTTPILVSPPEEISPKYGEDTLPNIIAGVLNRFGSFSEIRDLYELTASRTMSAALEHVTQEANVKFLRKARETKITGVNTLAISDALAKAGFSATVQQLESALKEAFAAIDRAKWGALYDQLIAAGSIQAAVDLVLAETDVKIATANDKFNLDRDYATYSIEVDKNVAEVMGGNNARAKVAIVNARGEQAIDLEVRVSRPYMLGIEKLNGVANLALAEIDRAATEAQTQVEKDSIQKSSAVTIRGILTSAESGATNTIVIAKTDAANTAASGALEASGIRTTATLRTQIDLAKTEAEIAADAARTEAEIKADFEIVKAESASTLDLARDRAKSEITLANNRATHTVALEALNLRDKMTLTRMDLLGEQFRASEEVVADKTLSDARNRSQNAESSVRILSKKALNAVEIQGVKTEASTSVQLLKLRTVAKLSYMRTIGGVRDSANIALSGIKIASTMERTSLTNRAEMLKAILLNQTSNQDTTARVAAISARSVLDTGKVRDAAITSNDSAVRLAEDARKAAIKTTKAVIEMHDKVARSLMLMSSVQNKVQMTFATFSALAQKHRIINEVKVEGSGASEQFPETIEGEKTADINAVMTANFATAIASIAANTNF